MTSKNKSLVKPTMRFRPQHLSGGLIMRERRQTGRTFNYNWQERTRWYPVGWKFNRQVIGRIFGHLHYLALHAPKPVQTRWRPAYRAFERRYLPMKGSMRFLNTWTAHSWL